MKLWCHATNTPMGQLLDFARILDDAGFDGIALTHHLVDLDVAGAEHPYRQSGEEKWWDASDTNDESTPDPWVTATAIANVTKTLTIGSSIFVLPLQDPFTVAKSVASASYFSRGRVVLGVGVGWMSGEFDLVGTDFRSRGARTDEMLDVMQLLFNGDVAEFHGRYFDFSDLRMAPPHSPGLPIYIGGESPRALQRAARFDGWFAAGPHDVPTAVERCRSVLAAREAAGTLDKPFECILPLWDVPTRGEWESLAEVGATGAMFVPARRQDLAIRTIDDRRAYAERIASLAQDLR